MNVRVFRDNESKLFYWLETSILVLVLIATAILGVQWYLDVILIIIIFGFFVAGPPLRAEVENNGVIKFIKPIGHTVITAALLRSVKGQGVHSYSAHILLRNKFSLVIMYRCRKYENASELAQAALDLIAKATNAKVDDNALKLLRQTAKGSTKQLPLK